MKKKTALVTATGLSLCVLSMLWVMSELGFKANASALGSAKHNAKAVAEMHFASARHNCADEKVDWAQLDPRSLEGKLEVFWLRYGTKNCSGTHVFTAYAKLDPGTKTWSFDYQSADLSMAPDSTFVGMDAGDAARFAFGFEVKRCLSEKVNAGSASLSNQRSDQNFYYATVSYQTSGANCTDPEARSADVKYRHSGIGGQRWFKN